MVLSGKHGHLGYVAIHALRHSSGVTDQSEAPSGHRVRCETM